MSSFDYKKYFNIGLNKIRTVRDPHPEPIYEQNLGSFNVLNSRIFDFGGHEHYLYNRSVDYAISISEECIRQIIISLAEARNIKIESVRFTEETKNGDFVFDGAIYYFACDNVLYLFKHCENSQMWLIGNITDKLMDSSKYEDCKVVYFLQGNIDLMIDKRKRNDMISIYEFWSTLFGYDEKIVFEKELNEYVMNVKKCLGYTIVKSLNPYSFINFKKVIENTIKKYSFVTLLDKKISDKYVIDENDYKVIHKSYFELKNYAVLFGKEEFADSFISSEWLYYSLKEAQAVDLTPIVLGYFKSIEQLLYSIILLHLDAGMAMKKKKSKCEKIGLSKANINFIDFSIGSMANFYKENHVVLSDKISRHGKEFIVESIFEFANFRNEFTHKHNIYDWNKVEEIRLASFQLGFLLIGGYKYDDKNKLSMPKAYDDSDFYRLCEYINFHAGDVFFLEKKGFEDVFVACSDEYLELIDGEHIKYSGVYFKNFGNYKKFKITIDNTPEVIWLADMGIKNNEKVNFELKKICKIFDNGKFVGKSIIEEYENDYY